MSGRQCFDDARQRPQPFAKGGMGDVARIGLYNHRRPFKRGRFDHGLGHFQITDVEGGHGKVLFVRMTQIFVWFFDKHELDCSCVAQVFNLQ